ncbi:hypothetical protein [Nocardiopsis sp. FIRDI 009]|uniref:hypothetical protein n=1 Tax=Nocardiopsis sp. FIRDI 009 TaxID=714197 RepID=UPI000E28188D|nr:hypothetical protein [Nocardiopsis sp. FIRDI 009]
MPFPVKKKIEVFDKRPQLDKESFNKGIPLQATAEQMRAIILYAPTLQLVGSIDNTNSDADTTWSRSVTTGFTFTQSLTIGVETALEVNVEFVKASMKISTSMTFSSQWARSVTETMQFSVPAGKKTFMYQGYIWSEIAIYENSEYKWSNEVARCLSNVMATSREPLATG